MSDYGSRYTDRRERILDLRLQRVYLEAQRDLQKKLDDFVQKKEKKNTEMLAKVANKEITEEEYKNWLSGQIFQEKQWKAKVDQATEVLLQSNRKAMTLIRDEQMNVFTENANYQAYDAEKASGFDPEISFELYDVASVDRLVEKKPELLPRKVVNGRKDKAWNQGNIANVIAQGIIQGESIPKIAKRMARDTASKNMRAMVRYARTAMTGAQNAGRMETMHRAEDMGIKVQKQWLATLDSRTRDSHRHLDGQIQDINDPFRSEFGKIMFPGDPTAHPGDVYNCRCTLVYVYPDFADKDAMRLDQETGEVIQDMTYKEWKDGKAKGKDKKETFVIPQRVRESVTRDEASEDWFEYEKANVMAEYIRTGKMPRKDMYQHEIGDEERQRLAAEAELIQTEGEKTKTKHKTLYRGMVMDQDEVREMFTPGQMVELDTITAATPDRKIANIYMNVDNAGGEGVPVIIEIQKPDGIYGFVRDDLETVLPKGSQFRCERNWMDQDGVVHISLYAKKGSFPKETLDNPRKDGNMVTGAVTGAKKTPGWEERHAKRYYKEIRSRKDYSDADKIAKSSPFTKEEAEKVRRHVFLDEHDLEDGRRRFDPDYDQAEAWQRLVNGDGTKEDEEFIRHELAEIKYMEEGYTQSEAHKLANKEHDWWSLVEKRKGGK